MEFATNPLDGVAVAYRSTGTGPAILMVHGTALSQVIWRGFGYLREFGADHTVITLDLRGHGRSGKPHESSAYRMELFVADVVAVLERLGVEAAHYLGYSLGGRVGFALADRHPRRVRRFVSVAGALGNEPGVFDRIFFPGCIDALETGDMTRFLDEWQAHCEGPLDKATRGAFAANDALALAAYMRQADEDAGIPPGRLASFAPRTLMLVGSKDAERLDTAQSVQALAPRASLHVITGAGHADVLRRPEVLPAIRAFLAAD